MKKKLYEYPMGYGQKYIRLSDNSSLWYNAETDTWEGIDSEGRHRSYGDVYIHLCVVKAFTVRGHKYIITLDL